MTAAGTPERTSGGGEERKPVTVLFADLAGSTELATRHDPEQLRALLSAFFEDMARHITLFGGTVEKYAGDAIMAVFGVPRVHEDDAERAVRAAFAMRDSLAQLNPMFEQEYGTALALRMGIATGEAVAATRETRELMVTGEVVNLAARLQASADGIVVSEETHRRLAPLLEAERLGALTLKGFPAPVTAYRVLGLRAVERRARGIPGLSSPVVGRDREMDAIRGCVDELARGRGQIVLITGEAGLGKSRLKIELREHPPEGVRWLEGRCHAYTQSTSYAPVTEILRAILSLSGAEPGPVARTKLRAALLALLGPRADELQGVIAHLLGVPPETGRPQPTDPRALQSQLLLAVRAVLEVLLRRSPVILAVEDLHWADASSIEVLAALTELADLLPLMVLATARPDPDSAAWEFRFHVQRNFSHRLTELQLGPLPADASERLVENLLHIADLPPALCQQILGLSEGNPFFVEEIVRTLIEEGVLRREADRWVTTRDAGRIPMPGTLRGVIAARIDRLPPAAKATLQRASVIGRFFAVRALRALEDSPEELDRALAHLLRAELVREWRRLPEGEYLFKHALTQEAAYASLLGEQRRLLHCRVAACLEETAPDTVVEQAALLADHWLRGDQWEKALHYTLLAAERARKLYSRPDAITHYWQALGLLDRLPVTEERKRLHIDALLVLWDLPGWRRNDEERAAAFEHVARASEAAADLGDQALMARIETVQGWLLQDEARLVRAVDRAEATGDDSVRAFAGRYYGGYLGQVGRYEASLAHIGRGIDLLGATGQLHEQGYEMAAGGRCYSARAGRLSEALDYAARARDLAESLDDPRLRAWRAMEAEPYMYKGLWEDVVRVAEEGLSHCWEIRELSVIFWASAWAAIACVRLGRHDKAESLLERALPECEAQGASGGWTMVWLQMALAELRLARGDGAGALTAARRAADIAEQSHFRLEQGAVLRVLGQVCESLDDRAAAATRFHRSLELLEAIQSRPELAQTLLAYGRFRAREDVAAGRAMIEQALAMFEEMGATGWVEEARRSPRGPAGPVETP